MQTCVRKVPAHTQTLVTIPNTVDCVIQLTVRSILFIEVNVVNFATVQRQRSICIFTSPFKGFFCVSDVAHLVRQCVRVLQRRAIIWSNFHPSEHTSATTYAPIKTPHTPSHRNRDSVHIHSNCKRTKHHRSSYEYM